MEVGPPKLVMDGFTQPTTAGDGCRKTEVICTSATRNPSWSTSGSRTSNLESHGRGRGGHSSMVDQWLEVVDPLAKLRGGAAGVGSLGYTHM